MARLVQSERQPANADRDRMILSNGASVLKKENQGNESKDTVRDRPGAGVGSAGGDDGGKNAAPGGDARGSQFPSRWLLDLQIKGAAGFRCLPAAVNDLGNGANRVQADGRQSLERMEPGPTHLHRYDKVNNDLILNGAPEPLEANRLGLAR